MANRVTIQDIADALGVSRNTVSKAINNTGILADETRERVLKKAIEMGYKQFSYVKTSTLAKEDNTSPRVTRETEIALFTTKFLGTSHFASTMLDMFQTEISQFGYGLSIHRVLPDEIKNKTLPLSFDQSKTAGIICYEMFDYEYSQMLCSLEIPALFVDTPVIGMNEPLKADCLYMNNQTEIFSFVREMIKRGKTKIGFIGEYLHCQSFFERYMAYRNAMYLNGLSCPEEYCIIHNKPNMDFPTSEGYQEYLLEKLGNLKSLPEVFICANDFVAFDVVHILQKLGYSVPNDVYLCGFDDSPESKLFIPSLTTIHIHSQIMGFSAVHLLISRIKEPDLNYRTVHTETNLIYRSSTED